MITRSKLEKISSKVRKGKEISAQDIKVIQEWRQLHNDLIASWQSILRNRISSQKLKSKTYVARRLKRFPTILNKLERNSSNLSTMHDIAGCRVIFKDLNDLHKFRESIHKNSKFKFKLISEDKYNYIESPKADGYRGIHDVYIYTGDKPYANSSIKNNLELKIEIQYRTVAQHIWATTVETLGNLTLKHIKFKKADSITSEYFQCCSEIFLRANENHSASILSLSSGRLLLQYLYLEGKTGILKRLNLYKEGIKVLSKNKAEKIHVLVLDTSKTSEKPKLQVDSYETSKNALEAYNAIEQKIGSTPYLDAVMVSTDIKRNLKTLFPNYFLKTKDFNELLLSSLLKITDDAIAKDYKNTFFKRLALKLLRLLIKNNDYFLIHTSGKLRKKSKSTT